MSEYTIEAVEDAVEAEAVEVVEGEEALEVQPVEVSEEVVKEAEDHEHEKSEEEVTE